MREGCLGEGGGVWVREGCLGEGGGVWVAGAGISTFTFY